MARHRRLSASQQPDPRRTSPHRHAHFNPDLISGPSGRELPPMNLEESASEVDSDPEDDHLLQKQLQSDLDQTAEQKDDISEKDGTPETATKFWQVLQPGKMPFEVAKDFNELTCAQKDHRVCKGLGFLVDEIERFTKAKVGRAEPGFMDHFLRKENKEVIRYIGCIAQGGPTGIDGWNYLLTNRTCRQALMIGIIGRALEEHVFSALFFGGQPRLTESLDKMERDQIDGEGFSRTKDRAEIILRDRPNQKLKYFEDDVTDVTIQLTSMLGAFCEEHAELGDGLYSIVHHAGQLSRMMRMASDIVYYWPPTFKDEEYEPSRMEAQNLKEMIEGSPYDKETINGRDRAKLKAGRENQSEAIVRVVCFPGLAAYRQFGGELAKKEIAEEKRGIPVPADVQAHRRRAGEQPLTVDQGLRSRVVRKSLVLLQWGKQRLLTKEAGTSSHIDAVRDDKMAKYDSDYVGFEELYAIAEERWGGDTDMER